MDWTTWVQTLFHYLKVIWASSVILLSLSFLTKKKKKKKRLSSGNFCENKNDVVRSSILEHKVNYSIYWVGEKFIWVFCNILKKNPNELLGQPNMLAIIIKRGLTFLKFLSIFCKFQFSSVIQSCPTLCNLMDCNRPGLPVHYQLL